MWAQVSPAINIAWLPVTDEERQSSAPVVDKNAAVEGLFWRVHVYDEYRGESVERVLQHYVRLKVFTPAGKDKATNLDLSFDKDTTILAIAGRTVKQDGTIVELKNDDVHEREVVRVGDIRRKVKTITMPGVEAGAIVEYRWKEIQHHARLMYMRLQFQREYPIRKVTYFIKPLASDYTTFRMNLWPWNCQPSKLEVGTDNFHSTTLLNVPAFTEEPLMPGEAQVRAWALLFYKQDGDRQPDKYWSDIGKERYKWLKNGLKASAEVKDATAKALAGAKTDDKVLAILQYIRANVKNLFDSEVPEADRLKVLKQMPKDRWRTSAEILKSGLGTADELNLLFAAMVAQVGLEARPVLVGDRSDAGFSPEMVESYFLESVDMAVKAGDAWKLYDVSAATLPAGMLSWREQGMQVLLSDPKKPVFIKSDISPAEASAAKRNGRMKVLEDGTLEGDFQEIHTGHMAGTRRSAMLRETGEKRIERIKDALLRAFPKAEVSDIHVGGVDDPEAPLVVQFHLRVPSYAQRTGKRIFLQPFVFQYGDPPRFTAANREYDIHFRYAWSETDDLTIQLPAGFELDNPEKPGEVNFGDVGGYKVRMAITPGGELQCRRELVFGRGERIMFPKAAYPQLKGGFDVIHKSDNHTLALRQAAK